MTTALGNYISDHADEAEEAELESGSVRAGKADDAFRTIGEAAAELGLKTHVLRFWETRFEALKPLKRLDGRRYYRPEDMDTLKTLQNLLHVQGMTIRGAIRALERGDASGLDDDDRIEETGSSVRDLQDVVRAAVERGEFRAGAAAENLAARERLEGLLSDLTRLKSRLDEVRTAESA